MKSFLISNLCTKFRVKLKDDNVLQCFSGFYEHPGMINEDAWHLVNANNVKVLVDRDTMHVMKDMVCEWGFSAAADTILTCKLTSTESDEKKRTQHWNALYEYAVSTRKAMAQHFSKSKMNELTDTLKSCTVADSSDPEPSGRARGKIQPVKD